MQGGQTPDTSLHTSLSVVLAALRNLEEVHNRRFVRVSQATNVRHTSVADRPQISAGSGAAPRDVFEASSEPIGQDMSEISATCPRLIQGPEPEENDEVGLHVFVVSKTRDEDLDLIRFQDYDLFANWVDLQRSSSWIPELSNADQEDISSWLFSRDICQIVMPGYDEFRPESTSTPSRRQVGATCAQCGASNYNPKPRSRLRILRTVSQRHVSAHPVRWRCGEKSHPSL
ncbi:hypothetical protein B0H14DRAFT_876928 [Mycena olivaceomarginata]|nr:hypothetical protein B0H14DRAFT_876928 [Mycena olivaceomarginata]